MSNTEKLRVVHYVNQFFGQEGQEDKADMQFMVKQGPVGPGLALQKILGDRAEVVATIVCGDNYFAENIDKAPEQGIPLITDQKPDLFFAGPAFEAGRYGMSCGAICKIVTERLAIPAITGMYQENPGVDLYRKDVYIWKTDRSAAKMVEDLTGMVNIAFKLVSKETGSRLVSGETIGRPSEDGYFPQGIVRNEFVEKNAAERGIDMLLAKLRGKPFQTEQEAPKHEIIQPPPPIKELSSSEIALISDGGLVPKGNPDDFKGRGNFAWAMYEIDTFIPEDYSPTSYEVAHTGYYPVHVLDDPNRLVPVDVMRDLVKEGTVGKLHPTFYSTSGNATVQKRCQEMGEEIVQKLKERGVDGAILTST